MLLIEAKIELEQLIKLVEVYTLFLLLLGLLSFRDDFLPNCLSFQSHIEGADDVIVLYVVKRCSAVCRLICIAEELLEIKVTAQDFVAKFSLDCIEIKLHIEWQ